MRRSLVVLLLVVSGCAKKIAPAAASTVFRNAPVILISIDTLRADHVPVYGYKSVETPAIDTLARDGVVFEQTWSHCPMTLPSHVSMLTGQLPTTHGVRNNLGFRYEAAKHPTIAQRLRDSGYVTGAAVSSYVLRGETGLRDAFDWYDDVVDPSPGGRFREYQRSGFTTASLAKQWVDSVGSRPFFLFLHLYEPHVPYEPPEPFKSRYANAYDGEIATADAIVGDFLQHLKARNLYESSIIVLTSDHGEGLLDHGEAQHSILLYTEAIRVPLIVKLPRGVRHGSRSASPAALVDIAPTVAALTATALPQNDGMNLFGAARDKRTIYSETIYPYIELGWSDLRSIVAGRFHYIESPRPELYDIAEDPHERNDVIAQHRREAATLRDDLVHFPPPTTGDTAVAPADAAKLAALGYIGAIRQRPDPATLPNPRDVVGTLDEIRSVYELASQRRYAEAMPRFEALLAANPRLIDVRVRLAEMELDMGRTDDAIRDYKSAIANSAVFPAEIAASLAETYLQSGRLADAETAAESAIAGSPDRARRVEIRVALAKKDLRRANELAAPLANEANASPADLLLLAEIRSAAGDANGALRLIGEADVRARANGEKGIYGLEALRAEQLMRLERAREAAAAYEREIALFPRNRTAYSRLAVIYFILGDRRNVDRTLERLVAANPAPASYDLAARTLDAVEDVNGARRWRARMPRQ